MAIWPLTTEIGRKLPDLAQHCLNPDVGNVAGSEKDLCKTLEALTVTGAKFNLELMEYKCEL